MGLCMEVARFAEELMLTFVSLYNQILSFLPPLQWCENKPRYMLGWNSSRSLGVLRENVPLPIGKPCGRQRISLDLHQHFNWRERWGGVVAGSRYWVPPPVKSSTLIFLLLPCSTHPVMLPASSGLLCWHYMWDPHHCLWWQPRSTLITYCNNNPNNN